MILGLDFEGTLHPMDRRDGFLSCRPRFEACLREYPAVELLVTTAYRTDHTISKIRSLFSADIAARIVGVTPNRYIDIGIENAQRQREIEQWIKENRVKDTPWLALDDSDWLFDPACPNLILVDPYNGFGDAEETQLRQHLQSYLVPA